MASTETISLNREEVRQIMDALNKAGAGVITGLNQEGKQRYFRLLVKLDKALEKDGRWWGIFFELPDWIREILHSTFAPQPAPAKKKQAKTPAPAAPAAKRHGRFVGDAAAVRRSAIARKGGLARAAKAAAQRKALRGDQQPLARASAAPDPAQRVTAAAG